MATINAAAPMPDPLRTQRSSYHPPTPAPYPSPGRIPSGTVPAYGPPPTSHPSASGGYASAPLTGSGGYVRVSAPPPPPAKSGGNGKWIIFAVVLVFCCVAAGLMIGLALYKGGG